MNSAGPPTSKEDARERDARPIDTIARAAHADRALRVRGRALARRDRFTTAARHFRATSRSFSPSIDVADRLGGRHSFHSAQYKMMLPSPHYFFTPDNAGRHSSAAFTPTIDYWRCIADAGIFQ